MSSAAHQTAAAAVGADAQVNPYSRPATPHPQHQIGWVGLGNMGRNMALNLARNLAQRQPPLPPLLVNNRTTEKAHTFAKESNGAAKACDDVVEMGQRCDLVFVSLGDDKAAKEIFAKLIEGEEKKNGKAGQRNANAGKTIFVDTSTLYPETTGELEREISSVPNRYFIAAPTFGPPPMAQAGTLVFAIAGPHNAKKFVTQFLVPGVGRKVMDFGSNPERAASFKLIGNSLILSTIEMLSECMTLAEKTGAGAQQFFDFVEEFYPAPSAIGYAKKLLTHNFDSSEGFTLDGGIKDASHIRRLGASVDCPLPIVDVAHQHLIAARANAPAGKALDWSSLVAGQRMASGLPPFGKREGLQRDGGRRDE